MTEARARVDRAAAVRRALVRLVAERGFHGASMGAVAKEAGVATGTAYVHYASKEELVYATYLEVKRELMGAAAAAVETDAPGPGSGGASGPASVSGRDRFARMWRAAYEHLAEHPDHARFLVQVDASPFGGPAHERATASDGDPLLAVPAVAALMQEFAPLPPRVLFDLALGPVLRLVAAGEELPAADLPRLTEACWRAVTRD